MNNSPGSVSPRLALRLSELYAIIDQIADGAGVHDSERSSVETTLIALPSFHRRRVVLALQSRKAFTADPDLQAACTILLERAANLWAQADTAPVQPAGLSLQEPFDLPIAAKPPTD